jgi:hypothetical protein
MNNIYLSILGSTSFSNILNELEFNNILNPNNISIISSKKILVINKNELDFFLKGNTSLEEVEDRCPANWISVAGWKDI